jgi:predicted transglutaminase-like cysteine proteinase
MTHGGDVARKIEPLQSPQLIVGENVNAPPGWVRFCEDYTPVCNTTPAEKRIVVLDAKARRNLQAVNDMINQQIKPMTDYQHWGTANERYVYRDRDSTGKIDVEKWDYAEDGYGDCDEYSLVKRRRLLEMAWPRSALLITVVRHYEEVDGEKKPLGHLVLTVKTTEGDLILDNLVPEIKQWWQTDQQFIKRQSEGDPNTWVALQHPTNVSVN